MPRYSSIQERTNFSVPHKNSISDFLKWLLVTYYVHQLVPDSPCAGSFANTSRLYSINEVGNFDNSYFRKKAANFRRLGYYESHVLSVRKLGNVVQVLTVRAELLS